MVQIGGYIKKHQGKNTKDLVKPRVCELAIHLIHGENKIIQTQFTLNWTFEWKKNLMTLYLNWATRKLLLLTFRMLWDIYEFDTSG